jgi:hypothetical protein
MLCRHVCMCPHLHVCIVRTCKPAEVRSPKKVSDPLTSFQKKKIPPPASPRIGMGAPATPDSISMSRAFSISLSRWPTHLANSSCTLEARLPELPSLLPSSTAAPTAALLLELATGSGSSPLPAADLEPTGSDESTERGASSTTAAARRRGTFFRAFQSRGAIGLWGRGCTPPRVCNIGLGMIVVICKELRVTEGCPRAPVNPPTHTHTDHNQTKEVLQERVPRAATIFTDRRFQGSRIT